MVRPVNDPVSQVPSPQKTPPKRILATAAALLLGLAGLATLKLWVLAHMVMAHIS
jgi:hypothetical protein